MCEAYGVLLREEARGVLDREWSRVRRGPRPERVARGDAVDVDDGEALCAAGFELAENGDEIVLLLNHRLDAATKTVAAANARPSR